MKAINTSQTTGYVYAIIVLVMWMFAEYFGTVLAAWIFGG